MDSDALERQLDILLDMGCNAIQTSHNSPTEELMDMCDRKSLLVLDEVFNEWSSQSKINGGYALRFDEEAEHDLVNFLKRDRNHPCIFMWSIENEVMDQYHPQGAATAKWMADICRQLDVLGVNYCIDCYEKYHKGSKCDHIGNGDGFLCFFKRRISISGGRAGWCGKARRILSCVFLRYAGSGMGIYA